MHYKQRRASGSWSKKKKKKKEKKIKIRILFYESETWRTTVTTLKKVQTFIDICFRRLFEFADQTELAMKNHGSLQNNNLQIKKSAKTLEMAGSHSCKTFILEEKRKRRKEKKSPPRKHGAVTWMQTWRRQASPEDGWSSLLTARVTREHLF